MVVEGQFGLIENLLDFARGWLGAGLGQDRDIVDIDFDILQDRRQVETFLLPSLRWTQ